MQAVILGAGEGSRVRPLTWSRPKSLIPVANRPIIGHIIESLTKNGIRDIVVVVGYRREQVIQYLNSLDVPIRVVVQEKQLGTAHALLCARSEVTDDFLVLPGDNWIDSDSIGRIKNEKNAMLVKEHERPTNFGVVEIEGGYLKNIIEKPAIAPTVTVSTGILSLTPNFFDYIDSNEIPDAIERMIHQGECIKAVNADDWQDAIVPWDFLKMNAHLLKRVTARHEGTISRNVITHGRVNIGKGTTIQPNTIIYGPTIIGSQCEIGPNATIFPNTSIGSRVSIDPYCLIGNSLIMDDVTIQSHSRIIDTVIGEGCMFRDHTTTQPQETLFDIQEEIWKAEFGAIIGDKVKGAPFTTFKNCIVGNNVSINSGTVVTSIIPDGSTVM